MPRLYHRPPKYALHKGTKQATVSLRGKRVYLGPYGSRVSHAKYQEVHQLWQSERGQQTAAKPEEQPGKAAQITPATLREKRRQGSPLTVN